MRQIINMRLSKIIISILILVFCLGITNGYAKGDLVKKVIKYVAKSFAEALIDNVVEDILDKSKPQPSVIARISNVSIYHNQYMWNTLGIALNFSLNIEGGKDCVTYIAAYFSYGNGMILQDYNGVFRSPDGQIAVGISLIPLYENTNFSSLMLFIPYSELHMAPGNYLLKADFLVYTESGTIIGIHRNNYFSFNNSF